MNALSSHKLLKKTAFFLLIFAFSCTPEEPPPVIEISSAPKPAEEPPTTVQMIKSLKSIAKKGTNRAEIIADVRFLLKATDYERRGKQKQALENWYEALKLGEGAFGKKIFISWLKSYVKQLGKKTDVDLLAKLVLAELSGGKISPYLIEQGLITQKLMEAQLKKHVPEWIKPTLVAETSPQESSVFPEHDPLLEKTANIYCKADEQKKLVINEEAKKLALGLNDYWFGLISECEKKYEKSLESLSEAIRRNGKDKKFTTFALNASIHKIKIYRRSGDRPGASEEYLKLMNLWQLKTLKAELFEQSDIEFMFRRINDSLWAARYRALTGHLDDGRRFAKQAQELIVKLSIKYPTLTEKENQQIMEYKAESYHVLSSRISIEKKDFETSISLNMIALQIPNLSDAWKDRFKWYLGIYSYIAGDYMSARGQWEALLAETKEQTIRPQIYFWLAKVYRKLNQDAESKFYFHALNEEYPLSYYSVVGSKNSSITNADEWKKYFSPRSSLEKSLADRDNFDLEIFRNHQLIKKLLLRAEIMVAADLGQWSKLAVIELTKAVKKEFIITKKSLSAFVYLSRLQYASESYLQAISLTTEMRRAYQGFWQEWPEQIVIYYPRPFTDYFRKHADYQHLDIELLYGVARQESSFRPKVKSWAGAIGIMQLIPATARRMASKFELIGNDLEQRLLEPKYNIKLGSLYLRELNRYFKGFQPAVLGGYNAGEYAVDQWLARRKHSDPLMWVELVPFSQTKDYIKLVWRNILVYSFLNRHDNRRAQNPKINRFAKSLLSKPLSP